MNRDLKSMVDDLLAQANPADGVDAGTRLQQMIASSGKVFSEGDLIDAGRKLGMTDDQIGVFMEELASWY